MTDAGALAVHTGRTHLSPGTCRASRQVDHDIDGLAVPTAVVHGPASAAVQPDQAVEQGQAPAGFVLGGWLPSHRPARAAVVDLHPQVAAGVRHAELDLPVTVADGVGDQLADDELSEISVLAQAPFEKRLASLLAGVPDLRRLVAHLAGNGMLECGGQRHSPLPEWAVSVQIPQ